MECKVPHIRRKVLSTNRDLACLGSSSSSRSVDGAGATDGGFKDVSFAESDLSALATRVSRLEKMVP